MIKLEISLQEAQVAVRLFDMAVRANGLQAAPNAMYLANKLLPLMAAEAERLKAEEAKDVSSAA